MDSLYIHIPFCRSKCHYCSFVSQAGQESLYHRYTMALIQEIKIRAEKIEPCRLKTIFIGGGTPTTVPLELLSQVIESINHSFTLAGDVEFSLEANPESVEYEGLKRLRQLGINRISFGVQSFNGAYLKQLGRVHSGIMACEAVVSAAKAGFGKISLDLMYGLPGQEPKDHRHNVEQAVNLPITHLSIYELLIEENTPFFTAQRKGFLHLPPEESVVAMDEISFDICQKAGLTRYEISNFARPGHECHHNITYWQNREYMGVGAAAVSYENGVRSKNSVETVEYCQLIESGQTATWEKEQLSKEKSFKETIILGLRMIKGVEIQALVSRYQIDFKDFYGGMLGELKEKNLLNWNKTHLYLTPLGLQFANQVMADLV